MTLRNDSYTSTELHRDLEEDRFIGLNGGNNLPFMAVAEAQSGVDMHAIRCQRSPDEFYVESINEHLKAPQTQERWGDIVSLDPHGMWAKRPTISATYARMYLAEMAELERDGTIVAEDGGINVVKGAIDLVWNLPGFSSRLNLPESKLRDALYKYTNNPQLHDTDLKAYLPSCGGITFYIFGDIRKMQDLSTEVAIRVHDECNGSDVFGTDICTCRPYLMFAVEGAVACAQRGGVGIVCYFRKEGRALGEVTKFRVYNARKNQADGDRPEKYFYQTETIAGVRDARIQEIMPDVLLWLGVKRIDWLMSMSSDKFDAIDAAGIKVMQRISLPDDLVPEGASVEINAKISAGYHTDNISSTDIHSKLKQLSTVREMAHKIMDLAKADKLRHFKLDLNKIGKASKLVVDCIRKDYNSYTDIPYHSRLRHFVIGGVDFLKPLVDSWPCDAMEKTRRVLDLVTVSVLLDAGAGANWKLVGSDGKVHFRSEGLALASLNLFKDGLCSSDDAVHHRVNSLGLRRLELGHVAAAFQVNDSNPLLGLAGRHGILQRLGDALDNHPDIFGHEIARPGHILDHVLKHASEDKHVSISVLWDAIINALADVWPATFSGARRGDVWIYNPLKQVGVPGSDLVPFHKLSQWLMLSLLEPLEQFGLVFDDMHLITALAEYRNGGLFVDTGVLTLRDKKALEVEHPVGSELIVEWRAMTICLVDMVADRVREKLGATAEELSLPKILEGGTWKAGRVIAFQKRSSGNPPIMIRSDGTVF